MEFEKQIENVEIFIDRTPRIYLKWDNTEQGRDKNDCYERIDLGTNSFYINTHNRQNIISCGNPFWNKLEKLYQKHNNK